jgi:hypothetical protein
MYLITKIKERDKGTIRKAFMIVAHLGRGRKVWQISTGAVGGNNFLALCVHRAKMEKLMDRQTDKDNPYGLMVSMLGLS